LKCRRRLRLGLEPQNKESIPHKEGITSEKLKKERFGKREVAGETLQCWMSDVWKCGKKKNKIRCILITICKIEMLLCGVGWGSGSGSDNLPCCRVIFIHFLYFFQGEDADLCSELLNESLEALQSLPEATLFDENSVSPVWLEVVERSDKFLRQVVLG
jgi:hypothetical protein